ncbi:MAG TPA: cell division protein ZipA C-terminal FtsZ-binding domain-containing protein [Gammaproteobacteria bacterium]
MWDLRWVLLGLGALVLIAVYLWSRGILSRDLLPSMPRRKERTEPSIGEPPAVEPATQPASLVETVSEEEKARPGPERVVALRLIPRGAELPTERAVAALRGAGLEHGRYAIFHRQLGTNREGFSVASLTEPGSFDLEQLGDGTIAGLSFFLVLPGMGDPVSRFDAMVETARRLSVELAADLFDERGSSWSSQRERYLREELIEYRHQSDRR